MQAALERDAKEVQKTASRSEILDYLSYDKAMVSSCMGTSWQDVVFEWDVCC